MKSRFQITGQAKGSRTKFILKGVIDGLSSALIAADYVRHYRDSMASAFPNSEKSKLPVPKRIVITITLP